MRIQEVSKRYAKSLYSVMKQKGLVSQGFNQIKEISEIINRDKAVSIFFADPLISREDKIKMMRTAFLDKGIIQEIYNLMQLLAEKGRVQNINEIVYAYQAKLDEENGITRGIVKSSRPLDEKAQKKLEATLGEKLGKKIVLSFVEDMNLMGGIVAEVGGWTYDDSLKKHLNKINEDLNRSAY